MVPASRSVYEHVPYQSQVEKEFVEGLEKRDDVHQDGAWHNADAADRNTPSARLRIDGSAYLRCG